VIVVGVAVEIVAAVPVSPRGIIKFSEAALDVPTFTTDADVPAAPVVVEFTAIVAADPVAPVGSPRFKVWLGAVPVTDAVADPPAATVVTVPIDRVFAGPVDPVSPFSPVTPIAVTSYEPVDTETSTFVVSIVTETLVFIG
jgi:hypothetical protein